VRRLGTTRLAAVVAGAGLLAACGPGAPPPDVLIVTWDTVRWDHVGPDAQGRSATPTFDRLAREGVRFAEARAPAAITLPSHATLLTGLFPAHHGARDNGLFRVRPEAPRLAARLREAGYRTGAFVSAAVLAARYGLAEGFDHYDEVPAAGGAPAGTAAAFGRVGERRADATVERAIAWLAEDASRPVFLWLHLYDPHRSWNAPAPHADRHDPYRAEIAFADAQTDRLLEALARRDRLDRTLLVLTADHGEGLGEHGEPSHSYFAYDSTLRVPLLFWAGEALGEGWRRGAEVPGPASLADVAPTLASGLGLAPAPSDGRSLEPSLRGAPVPPRRLPIESVVPELDFGARAVFGVIDEAGQVWIDGHERQRYDVRRDPGQRRDLYRPADRAEADRLFASVDRDWPPAERPLELDADSRGELAALGYLSDAAPAADPAAERPDARKRVELFAFLMTGHQQLAPFDALERAAELERRHGPLPALTRFRLSILDALGRSADVIALLDELAGDETEPTELAAQLARRRAERARLQRLADTIRSHIANERAPERAARDLALTLHRLQVFDEAEALYRDELRRHPDDDELRANLARLLVADGRSEAALEALRAGRDAPSRLDCLAGRIEAAHRRHLAAAERAFAACRAAGGHPAGADLEALEALRRADPAARLAHSVGH